jgi:DNA modification methylase
VTALEPYYDDGQVRLYSGNAAEVLSGLPAGSAGCCVTSPPYFNLRDYDVVGQHGMEESPAEYVEHLREVFAGVRRVLADDGTLWVNLTDTYYSGRGNPGPGSRDSRQRARRGWVRPVDRGGQPWGTRKSLLGIPWMVAFALIADKWTLRATVTWQRTTAQPEASAHDRPWRTTETLFLLTKGPRYWFDRSALDGEEDVWTIEPDRTSGSGDHPAPFPLALPARCIRSGCRPGAAVIDPYAGTCSTIDAARMTGHPATGIDLNPAYLDIGIRARLSQGDLFSEAAS